MDPFTIIIIIILYSISLLYVHFKSFLKKFLDEKKPTLLF